MACMYGIDLQSKFPEKFPYEKDFSGELTFFQFCLENYIYENKLDLDQLLEKMKADSYFCHDFRKSVIEYYIKKIAEFSQEPDRRFYSHMLLWDSDALVKNALENIIKFKDFFVSFEDLISRKYLEFELDFSNDEEDEESEEWTREHESEIFGEALNGDSTYLD